jgi:hypothetical protein
MIQNGTSEKKYLVFRYTILVVNVLICGHPLVREKEERFWFPSYLMAVNSLAICGRTKETVIFGKTE